MHRLFPWLWDERVAVESCWRSARTAMRLLLLLSLSVCVCVCVSLLIRGRRSVAGGVKGHQGPLFHSTSVRSSLLPPVLRSFICSALHLLSSLSGCPGWCSPNFPALPEFLLGSLASRQAWITAAHVSRSMGTNEASLKSVGSKVSVVVLTAFARGDASLSEGLALLSFRGGGGRGTPFGFVNPWRFNMSLVFSQIPPQRVRVTRKKVINADRHPWPSFLGRSGFVSPTERISDEESVCYRGQQAP